MRVLTSAALLLVGPLVAATPAVAQWEPDEPPAAEASSAHSDGHPEDIEMVGWFGIGAGGTAETDAGISGELDATVGLGARLEIPVTEYIVVGGQFQMGFWQIRPANDRNGWFDFDAVIKGRYLFDVGGFALEAYALMPIGFTYSTFAADAVDGGPGWNIGLLFGAQFYFIADLAFVLEMGWQQHHTWHDTTLAGVETDYKANQFVMNFGIALPF